MSGERRDAKKSILLTRPIAAGGSGQTAAHQYKLGQNQNAFNDFKNSVSVWIAAEK